MTKDNIVGGICIAIGLICLIFISPVINYPVIPSIKIIKEIVGNSLIIAGVLLLLSNSTTKERRSF